MMSQKPKKWPDYALVVYEDVLMHLKAIDKLAQEAEVAALNNEPEQVIRLVSQIRSRAVTAMGLLMQAKTGNYDL